MVSDLLPDDWQRMTLADIAVKDYGLVDGPFGSSLPASDYVKYGIPVIRGSNLTMGDGFFKSDEFVYVSNETAQRHNRSLCHAEDIIFTKKGTLGQTGFVPHDPRFEKYLTSSNQMKLTVNRKVANPLYVYYYVSSTKSREKIRRDSESTGVPKTNLEYLRTYPILLPPLPTQHAIANILGSLDDKIELNRQMNETLEAMARAIFKSWFVDFDPVRAKAEGRNTGLPLEIAVLFPDGFVEIDGWEVPEGWGVETLGNVIDLAYGEPLKGENRRGGPIPVYGSNGRIGWHDEKLVKGPGIIVGRKGNPGIIHWSATDFFPIDTTFYVIPKKSDFSLYYLYHELQRQDLPSLGADSAVPGLNRNMAYFSTIVIPSSRILKKFDEVIKSLDKLIQNNEQQSRTLAQIRDALLPKLMSGEIRIKS